MFAKKLKANYENITFYDFFTLKRVVWEACGELKFQQRCILLSRVEEMRFVVFECMFEEVEKIA